MPDHTGGVSVTSCGKAVVASRDNNGASVISRGNNAVCGEIVSLRTTTTLQPRHTRAYWLSHCPATPPLPPLVKRLLLLVTTLLLLCATTGRLSLRVTIQRFLRFGLWTFF